MNSLLLISFVFFNKKNSFLMLRISQTQFESINETMLNFKLASAEIIQSDFIATKLMWKVETAQWRTSEHMMGPGTDLPLLCDLLLDNMPRHVRLQELSPSEIIPSYPQCWCWCWCWPHWPNVYIICLFQLKWNKIESLPIFHRTLIDPKSIRTRHPLELQIGWNIFD